MAELPEIEQADALDRGEIIVTLSDGRILVITLPQLLSLDARVLPPDDEDEDSD